MDVTIEDVKCPACGEAFDFDFDPQQEINDVSCPECAEDLVVASYDAAAKTVQLAVFEPEEEEETQEDDETEGEGEEGDEDEEPEG